MRPLAIDLLPEKIRARIIVSDGCWECSGWHNNLGYSYVRWEGKGRPIHRLVVQFVQGVILPKGIDVDHLCRNPGCVRPDHLEAVTHRENIRRGKAATKMACNYGHDWTNPANVYIRKSGKRYCAECSRISQRVQRA